MNDYAWSDEDSKRVVLLWRCIFV